MDEEIETDRGQITYAPSKWDSNSSSMTLHSQTLDYTVTLYLTGSTEEYLHAQ